MTINVSTNAVTWLGNGATTVFSYSFAMPAGCASLLYTDASGNQNTVASGAYTITGVGQPTAGGGPQGGTVTYAPGGSPIAAGTTLTLIRTVPDTQPNSFSNQGGLWPSVVESSDDNLEMQIQQLAWGLSRALLFNPADTGPFATFPPAAQRARQVLGFDSSGNPIAALPSSALVSAAMQPVVGAASIQAAMALLTFIATGSSFVRTLLGKLGDIMTAADFGVVGNGVADDTAAMQAAINAAQSQNRTLLVSGTSGGTFKITAPLNIAGPLRLVGQSQTQTTFVPSGNFAAILSFGASANNVWVEHLTLLQSGTTTLCVTAAYGSQVIKFFDVCFYGDINGELVYTQCSGFFELDECVWQCNSANTIGIVYDGFNQNDKISKARAGGPGTWIVIQNTSGVPTNGLQGLRISNSVSICTGAFAINIGGDAVLVIIEGCTLDQAATNVIITGQNATDILIDGNWLGLQAASTGQALLAGATTGVGLNVANNVFYGGTANVAVGASASLRVGKVSIVNNVFSGASSASLQLDSVNGCDVLGNTETASPSQGSWITLGTNASGGAYTFGGNSWSATAPSTVHSASSYHATPDRGVTLASKGVASSASGTTLVVTHGLVLTPNVIQITQLGGGGMNATISARGATTFTISYGTAGAATFMWEAEYYT